MMKKIADLPEPSRPWVLERKPPCHHPEHDPPKHIVLEPGIYEHECPGCGQKQIIRVERHGWQPVRVDEGRLHDENR